MARRKLTEEEMAAKVAKMKATKAANKAAAIAKLGLERAPTKFKKARKKRELTPEQKAANIARLAKAREAKGPSQNKLIDEHVRNLPDDNPLSLVNVRSWIKDNKEQLQAIKHFKDSKDAKERNLYTDTATYISNLESYLRDGMYRDFRYGAGKQNKISMRVTTMAYYSDGTPKRNVGWLYPDIGLYTQEMADEGA
jgi:hypothetical protein